MTSFKALLIEEHDGKVSSGLVQMDESALDAGSVTIRVAYSSINYKDALAATGAGKIIRRFPCVGGIDLSGTVVASTDPRFKSGDKVIATSFDIGVAHHGGYAEIARVPGDWVVPLPAGLSLFDAMALGTAGFTAALGIVRMEENGLRPAKGSAVSYTHLDVYKRQDSPCLGWFLNWFHLSLRQATAAFQPRAVAKDQRLTDAHAAALAEVVPRDRHW